MPSAPEYSFIRGEREALANFLAAGTCTPESFKHGTDPDDMYDVNQLARGVEVEMEHTDDPAVSRAIAKAHLAELPDYYTRLDKMEAEGKTQLGNNAKVGSGSSLSFIIPGAVRLCQYL